MCEQNKQLVRRYFEELDRGKTAPVQQMGALPVQEQTNVGARS